MRLEVLSQLALAAARPAGTGYWAGLAVVEPADSEPQVGSSAVRVVDTELPVGPLVALVVDREPLAGSLAALVTDKEPQVGSSVVLVTDMGQLVGTAFAGGLGAFPEEHSESGIVASGPVDPEPVDLWLVYRLLCQRVGVIPQSVEPSGGVGSN